MPSFQWPNLPSSQATASCSHVPKKLVVQVASPSPGYLFNFLFFKACIFLTSSHMLDCTQIHHVLFLLFQFSVNFSFILFCTPVQHSIRYYIYTQLLKKKILWFTLAQPIVYHKLRQESPDSDQLQERT
jgi:hypothetical protein